MSHTSLKSESETNICQGPCQIRMAFIDMSCSIKYNKIDIDLYKKKTYEYRYLLSSLCHPTQNAKSIPCSLSMRIVSICPGPAVRDKTLGELKHSLMARDYKERSVKSAIRGARAISCLNAPGKIIN